MFSAVCLPKLSRTWRTIAWLSPALAIVSLLSAPAWSLAARGTKKATAKPATEAASKSASPSARPAKIGTYNPNDETVEMFEAMEAGQIGVKLILKDSTQARVLIKNKTGKPLNVRLPKAFAGVPVLAQMGGGGQGAGGGMGGMGGMGGGGMFNVPAEKEANFKVACVCLEHGKPEPRAQMAYEIKPIESFTTKPGVAEMLTKLGEGRIDQRAAQVAAWHLNNDMSWETLAAKQIKLADGRSYPYFNAAELLAGKQIVEEALAAAEREKEADVTQASPGETAAR
ncbi:MAG: hypothetical protein ACREHD_14310 [Pirellulales bacterium]